MDSCDAFWREGDTFSRKTSTSPVAHRDPSLDTHVMRFFSTSLSFEMSGWL